MPPKKKCECGKCNRCKHREYMNRWYQAKSMKERRAWIALRDKDVVRANDRRRYYRDYKKRRAKANQYGKDHREELSKHQIVWAKKNSEKRKCHFAVSNALRDGRIFKGACEDSHLGQCSKKITAHHSDYSKPLCVTWLCTLHHGMRHRKYKEGDVQKCR